jgi:hypothetical protein
MTVRYRLSAALTVLMVSILPQFARAQAQVCFTTFGCTGIPSGVTFEALAPGTSVEGPGAVHPALSIVSSAGAYPPCAVGSAQVIEENNPFPYSAYGTLYGDNQCLTGFHGFADAAGCVLNYTFSFLPGYYSTCFSIRMTDFGDLFPFGTTTHEVVLEAYNSANLVIDSDNLLFFGPIQGGGDACDNQPGDPGQTVLAVSGIDIRKVVLTFQQEPDPNVGFDDVAFCLFEDPVPTIISSWGAIKSRFGD